MMHEQFKDLNKEPIHEWPKPITKLNNGEHGFIPNQCVALRNDSGGEIYVMHDYYVLVSKIPYENYENIFICKHDDKFYINVYEGITVPTVRFDFDNKLYTDGKIKKIEEVTFEPLSSNIVGEVLTSYAYYKN